MTAKDLYEIKLKEELIQLYERYLKNPKDRENLSKMDKVEQDYSSAHDFIKSNVLGNALVLAGCIEEKEISGSNTFLDDKDTFIEAKKILEELKKS